jgi:hypothetical protein
MSRARDRSLFHGPRLDRPRSGHHINFGQRARVHGARPSGGTIRQTSGNDLRSPRPSVLHAVARSSCEAFVFVDGPSDRTMVAKRPQDSRWASALLVQAGCFGERRICYVRRIFRHRTTASGRQRRTSLGGRDRLRRYHREILQWGQHSQMAVIVFGERGRVVLTTVL